MLTQFNNNTDNNQNYCKKNIVTEPCVIEPTTHVLTKTRSYKII